MNTTKREGERIEPCCTYAFEQNSFEQYPSSTTLIERASKRLDMNGAKMLSIPNAILCRTLWTHLPQRYKSGEFDEVGQ